VRLSNRDKAMRRGGSRPSAAPQAASPFRARPLIDRFGGRHSETVLRNWSPAAIAALGIRRADDDGSEQ
jgi:hypothetical protein